MAKTGHVTVGLPEGNPIGRSNPEQCDVISPRLLLLSPLNPAIPLESVMVFEQTPQVSPRISQHRIPVLRGLVVDSLSFGTCVRSSVRGIFQRVDQKIAAITADLEALSKKHDAQAAAVKEEFQIAHQREAEEFAKIQHGMTTIQQDLDRNLALTMKTHSQAMEKQFMELKSLFQQSAKRPKPEEADHDMNAS
eukprot:s2370_g10.t1